MKANSSELTSRPTLPSNESVRAKIRGDFLAWCRIGAWDPSKMAFLRLLILQPGFQLVASVRLREFIKRIPVFGRTMYSFISYFAAMWFSAEINSSELGPGLVFPHISGIVIGGGVIVGKNVTIYQGVTLGRSDSNNPGVPIVMDGVKIYAGAKIIGPVVIGEGAIVGANAVVLKDVPPAHVAVGVPARNMPIPN
jgi:serine O-acetyltransferase